MSGIISNLKSLIIRQRMADNHQPSVRLHHYMREENGYKARLHLRIDPDGHGTLMVNANRIVHFNPTATLMAKLALEETAEPEAIQAITKAYRVSKGQAQADYAAFMNDFTERIIEKKRVERDKLPVFNEAEIPAEDD